MGKIRLVGRLVARDLRRRPAQAVLLLLAITAATSILTLGLALHGVASQPYQQTRAATNGPDGVAEIAGPAAGPHGPGGPQKNSPAPLNRARALARLAGVPTYSGPYPVASSILQARGLPAGVEV